MFRLQIASFVLAHVNAFPSSGYIVLNCRVVKPCRHRLLLILWSDRAPDPNHKFCAANCGLSLLIDENTNRFHKYVRLMSLVSRGTYFFISFSKESLLMHNSNYNTVFRVLSLFLREVQLIDKQNWARTKYHSSCIKLSFSYWLFAVCNMRLLPVIIVGLPIVKVGSDQIVIQSHWWVAKSRK